MAYVVSNPANIGQYDLDGGTQVSINETADLIVTFDKLYVGPKTVETTFSLSTAAGDFDIEVVKAGLPDNSIVSNVTYDSPAEGIETVSYTVVEKVFFDDAINPV